MEDTMGKKTGKKKKNSAVAVTISITKQGELMVTDGKGRTLDPLDPEKLGKTLIGHEIKEAQSISITYLRSNPGWVCIGGNWYYIP